MGRLRWRRGGALSWVLVLVWATLGCGEALEPGPLPPRCAGPAAEGHFPEGVYLLTMYPGTQLFSYFGHNGLYVRRGAVDTIFNFGAFDTRDPNLLSGFVRGTQDYLLATRSFASMMDLYAREERTVVVTALHLPPAVEERLVTRLLFEAREENRVYRYHWFSANCSTRIRDLLDQVMDGSLAPQHGVESHRTQYSEVLRLVRQDVGVWFALSLTLYQGAHRPLTQWELAFLPEELRRLVLASTGEDGSPLSGEECTLLLGAPQRSQVPRFPVAWLAAVSLLVSGACVWGLRRGAARWGRVAAALVLGLWVSLGGLLGGLSLGLWWGRALEIFWANPLLLVMSPVGLVGPLLAAGLIGGWRWSRWLRWPLALMLMAQALALLLLPWWGSPLQMVQAALLWTPATLVAAWAVGWRRA